MMRMKEYAAWEVCQKPRSNFILTKTEPHIHYLPRRLNDKAKELLDASKVEIEALIEKKKHEVYEELKHIEDRMKRNFDAKYGSKEAKVDEEKHDPEEHEAHLDEVLTEPPTANEENEEGNKDIVNDTTTEVTNQDEEDTDKDNQNKENNDSANSENKDDKQEVSQSESINGCLIDQSSTNNPESETV